MNQADLLPKNRFAGFHLCGFRIPVIRRTAFEDIGDVDLFPIEIDRLENLGQQLSGRTYERQPLGILIRTRRLADQHQIGGFIA